MSRQYFSIWTIAGDALDGGAGGDAFDGSADIILHVWNLIDNGNASDGDPGARENAGNGDPGAVGYLLKWIRIKNSDKK